MEPQIENIVSDLASLETVIVNSMKACQDVWKEVGRFKAVLKPDPLAPAVTQETIDNVIAAVTQLKSDSLNTLTQIASAIQP